MHLFSNMFSKTFYLQANLLILFLCFASGLWILIWGSNLLLRGASSIARVFHVTEYAIGVTLVALSTSLPELFVSLQAILEKDDSIALANIVGSNIVNTMFLFMLLCFFSKRVMEIPLKNIILLSGLYVLLLLFIVLHINTVPRIAGIVLLTYTIFYFYREITVSRSIVLSNSNAGSRSVSNSDDNVACLQKSSIRTMVFSAVGIVLGIVLLRMGSELFLNSVKELGYRVGADERVIGIVFVALGTSLPELFVTLVALFFTKKVEENYTNIAAGNIIGSNILNILVVLGILSTISPVSGLLTLRFDIIVMLISGFLLFLMRFRTMMFQKLIGVLMLTMFILYAISLL